MYEVIYGQETTHLLPSRMIPCADKPNIVFSRNSQKVNSG